MLTYFGPSRSWSDLIKRTARKVIRDDAQGLAAQLAYYFFLALFPALLCLIAIASFFPLHNVTDQVARLLGPVAPNEMITLITQQMLTLSEGRHGGLLSLGLVGALWSSSGAMVAVVSAMNRAYDIEERRPWWQVRLTATLLTLGLALFIIVAFTLIVAGPQLADALARRVGLGSVFVWTWNLLQWPVAFVLVWTAFGSIYYFAPDAEQEWAWITPGAKVATILWFLGSLLFRWYAVNFGHYEATYGTIGGIILLLLWLYLSGFVIVIGAEMNAEIEHAAPCGTAPGETMSGQKKKVRSAAARHDPEHRTAPAAMLPTEVRPLALPPHEAPACVARLATYVTLFVRWRQRANT